MLLIAAIRDSCGEHDKSSEPLANSAASRARFACTGFSTGSGAGVWSAPTRCDPGLISVVTSPPSANRCGRRETNPLHRPQEQFADRIKPAATDDALQQVRLSCHGEHSAP